MVKERVFSTQSFGQNNTGQKIPQHNSILHPLYVCTTLDLYISFIVFISLWERVEEGCFLYNHISCLSKSNRYTGFLESAHNHILMYAAKRRSYRFVLYCCPIILYSKCLTKIGTPDFNHHRGRAQQMITTKVCFEPLMHLFQPQSYSMFCSAQIPFMG